MELKDLVGQHKLSGVDFTDEKIKTWGDNFEDCQVCRFCLDGIVYIAVEDPEDGYRSSMNELVIDEAATMKNTFTPVDVLAKHRGLKKYGEDDVLELIDASTGRIVLEVGTLSVDDYYPSFIANFHPENMVINQGRNE